MAEGDLAVGGAVFQSGVGPLREKTAASQSLQGPKVSNVRFFLGTGSSKAKEEQKKKECLIELLRLQPLKTLQNKCN